MVMLKVAIIGSGPSGFYAAEALLGALPDVEVDMLERLPTPFGLVRYGVAPDHQKLKQVTAAFDKIASDHRFRLFANVDVGKDVRSKELAELYDAAIFATGAASDKPLGIPGEALPGSYSATEFVAWYNGHPEHRDKTFDLSCEDVVIVGQGNVAIDVCRMLAKSVDELCKDSDICEYALDALSESRIRRIHLIGRRGPAQAKFTAKELRELGSLSRASVIVDPMDLKLSARCLAEAEADPAVAKNLSLFRSFADAQRTASFDININFFMSPTSLVGNSKVESVRLKRTRLEGPTGRQQAVPYGEPIRLAAGAVFRSVGYRGTPIDGLPFDEAAGIIPNRTGRVAFDRKEAPNNVYVAGWIKRGPTGIIGTNRACSFETVASVLADIATHPVRTSSPGREALSRVLYNRSVHPIDFAQWGSIDDHERRRGAQARKPREKFTSVPEMLAVALARTA
jgi:ferredoxin--NADP+ reductase